MFIVLNKCYGGFSLSKGFKDTYPEYNKWNFDNDYSVRADETFIERIREYGIGMAGGPFSNLSIISIPDDVTDWRIHEYDGYEYAEYVRDGKIYDA